jgi:hypothetical protein
MYKDNIITIIDENNNFESTYEIIEYNINSDNSLKETPRTWSEYFRKSWNITIIILLTSFVYMYYIYKKNPDNLSKF